MADKPGYNYWVSYILHSRESGHMLPFSQQVLSTYEIVDVPGLEHLIQLMKEQIMVSDGMPADTELTMTSWPHLLDIVDSFAEGINLQRLAESQRNPNDQLH